MEQETKQKHTPEPWTHSCFAGTYFIENPTGLHLLDQEKCPEAGYNAFRIVKFVNAMEGIEDPEEFMSTVKEAFKEEKLSVPKF